MNRLPALFAVAIFLVAPWSGARSAEPEDGKLGAQAFGFLKKYCAECHHGPKPASGVKNYDVLDYDNLTQKRTKGGKDVFLVKAGAKGKEALEMSRVWQRAGVEKQAGADGDMPPDDASAKPTDKEREEVLRKWLEAGAPAWPKEAAKPPDPVVEPSRVPDSELWFEVRTIFERRCLKCHDGPSPQSGVPDLQIVEHASLTAKRTAESRKERITDWKRDPWYYVKPGPASETLLDESLLYFMIKTDKMPRGSDKLTAGEKAIVKAWVAAGAPVPSAPQSRPNLSLRAQTAAIVAHLEALPEKDRPFQRYFTFAPWHNNRKLYDKDLKSYRAGLAKLVNSLSWEKILVVPRIVPGTQDAVLAVDLRELGWDKRNVWAQVIEHYPYALASDAAEVEKLKRLAGTPIPCVRADWFVTRASRPPLYHTFLDLPDDANQLEKRLGVDFVRNFREGKLARAGYLGASTTTSGFRVVERQAITTHDGAYWKSYDFGLGELKADYDDKHNPLLYCLGPSFDGHPFPQKAFLHDGSEIIFNLPNGMQGYLVADPKGRRMDAPPIWVLKDRNEFAGTPQLVNGISCMACHSQGMQTVSDQVRLQADKGGRIFDTPETRKLAASLYLPHKEMDVLLKADEKRFMDAVNTVTLPFLADRGRWTAQPRTEVIYAVTLAYRQHLTLEEAARELDYEQPEQLLKAMQADALLLRGLGVQPRLMQEGGKVSREEWMKAFAEAARRLKRGAPVTAQP
jgi:serine/threonine-protein kinase